MVTTLRRRRGEAILDVVSQHPGETLYVDPVNGLDTNDGLLFKTAKKTLQAAIDLTTADNGDVIMVAPGNHEVTSTVNFNKKGITVKAIPSGHAKPAAGEDFFVNAAASFTDGPAATVTQPCRIEGLAFGSRDLTKENLLIDSGGAGGFNGGFIELHNCRFAAYYGAVDACIRSKGGAVNYITQCTFDGLFGGFGTGAIVLENSGAIAPDYFWVEGNRFSSVGTGKHAIVHAVGSVPLGNVYKSNVLEAGFANQGKFLDNNNVASTGLVADNWVAPLANKAAAFENLTNSTMGFADNHYEEV